MFNFSVVILHTDQPSVLFNNLVMVDDAEQFRANDLLKVPTQHTIFSKESQISHWRTHEFLKGAKFSIAGTRTNENIKNKQKTDHSLKCLKLFVFKFQCYFK